MNLITFRTVGVALGLILCCSVAARSAPTLTFAFWSYDYHDVAFYPDGRRGCMLRTNRQWGAPSRTTIACSTDGGERWLPALEQTDLLFVLVLHPDSIHGWAGGRSDVLFRTDDGGRSWHRVMLDLPVSQYSLNSIHFASDASAGIASWTPSAYAREKVAVRKTNDGGRTWRRVALSAAATEIYDTFISPDGRLWALVNTHGPTDPPPDIALMTSSNGGESWAIERRLKPGLVWGRPTFESAPGGELVVVTVARQPMLSMDSGQRWRDYRNDFFDAYVAAVSPGGPTVFAVKSADRSPVWKMTLDAREWVPVSLPKEISTVSDVFTRDGRTIWLSGPSGTLLRSVDGGQSWNVLSEAPPWAGVPLHQIVASPDGRRLWVGGAVGTFLYSEDAGQNWSGQTLVAGVSTVFRTVSFQADSGHGWLAGDEGVILRTIDGGRTWIRGNTPRMVPAPSILALAFSADGARGLAVGDDGLILRSVDGGESWRRIQTRIPGRSPRFWNTGLASITSIHLTADGLQGVAFVENGVVLETSDGGETWDVSESSPPDAGTGFTHISATALHGGGNQGCIAGGIVYRGLATYCTTDGRRTWAASEFVPSRTGMVIAVAFDASGQRGLAALSEAPYPEARSWARTFDGGRRWYLVTENVLPRSIHSVTYGAGDGNAFWSVGDHGLLVRIQDFQREPSPQISAFSISNPDLSARVDVDDRLRRKDVNGYIRVSGFNMNVLGDLALRSFSLDNPQIAPWPPEMFREGQEYTFDLTLFDGWDIAQRSHTIQFGGRTNTAGGPAVEEVIDDLAALDLEKAIVDIDGQALPATELLVRGEDQKTRLKRAAPQAMTSADGFFMGVIRSTGQKLTLVKEQGMLRLFRPYKKSYALLIAVTEYRHASEFKRLPQAVAQAQELEKVLRAQGFEILPPLYDRAATADNIRNALRNAPVTEDDRLFVYFGGHGADSVGFNGDRYGYIVPYDAVKATLDEKGIPLEELTGRFSKLIRAKQVLFALDSCQSGLALTRGGDFDSDAERLRALRDIEAMSREPGRMFLTAGTGDQPAIDVNGGIFTRALIEAIQGKADVPRNGVTTYFELFEYIRTRVTNAARSYTEQQDPNEGVVVGRRGWVFVNDRTLLP